MLTKYLSTLLHHLRVLIVQLRNSWVRQAVYRANFLTILLVDAIWIGIEFSLFHVIYSNTQTLGDWTRDQTYFFLGIFFATDALFTAFFQRNFWQFSDLVNHGELDVFLTKPVSPLFLSLTRTFNINGLLNFTLGLAIVYRYSVPAGFPGGWNWLQVLGWTMGGLITAVLLRFFFSVWVFWTDRSWALSRLYYQLFALATKPDLIYPPLIRGIILTILPFALIGSLPARAILKGLTPSEILTVGLVWSGFFGLNWMLWRLGLRRYQSASS